MRGVAVVERLERYGLDRGKTLASLDIATMQAYIAGLIADGSNTIENLDALIHHMATTGNTDLHLYLEGLVAGRELLPSIARQLAEVAGAPACEQVFGGFALPPLGSHQRALPPVTQDILTRLRSAVGEDTAKRVLTGNHHGVPGEGFAPFRQVYLASGIDAALAERHRRLVGTLEQHLASAKPWFEQVVTPAFVEHVRSNQEVGPDSGTATGSTSAKCRMRLRLTSTHRTRPSNAVEVLESALAGHARCRFAIGIPTQR